MSNFVKILYGMLISVLIILSIFTPINAIPVESNTDASKSTQNHSNGLCREGNPCGWAVYGDSRSKTTKFFLKNTCKCAQNQLCIRSNDDLSLTAFVYRCKDKSSVDRT